MCQVHQLCGRVVSGLPLHNLQFATLPPHFDEVTTRGITGESWALILPGYADCPETFRQCIPFLVASIVFHETFLRENLAAHHPLFSGPLFTTGYVAQLRGKAMCGVQHCERTGMRATGIPSHFLIAKQITALQEQVAALQEAGRIERTELVARVNAVPGRVVDAILANISIGGAHPVTRDDLTALSASIVSQVLGAIDVRNSATAVNVTDEPPPVTTTASEANRFSTWMWEGRMQPVPQGWKLPRPCVKTFFLLWYSGNVDQKVGPLRSLCRFDVSPSDWVEGCRARSLFRHLESVLKRRI